MSGTCPRCGQRTGMFSGIGLKTAQPPASEAGPLTAQAIERTRGYLLKQCDADTYEPARVMINAVCDAAVCTEGGITKNRRMLRLCRSLLDDGMWQSYDRREDVRDVAEWLDGLLPSPYVNEESR